MEVLGISIAWPVLAKLMLPGHACYLVGFSNSMLLTSQLTLGYCTMASLYFTLDYPTVHSTAFYHGST